MNRLQTRRRIIDLFQNGLGVQPDPSRINEAPARTDNNCDQQCGVDNRLAADNVTTQSTISERSTASISSYIATSFVAIRLVGANDTGEVQSYICSS